MPSLVASSTANVGPIDPRALFLRWKESFVNLMTIDSVVAGSHRKGETSLLVYWMNDPRMIADSISGEDADAFAVDFWKATGRDVYVALKIEKPRWVAREMGSSDGDEGEMGQIASDFCLSLTGGRFRSDGNKAG